MITRRTLVVAALLTALAASAPAGAQQVQIPTLQVCNKTTVVGSVRVKIDTRAGGPTGTFEVKIDMRCATSPPPVTTGYPTGTLSINNISMSDTSSLIPSSITATFEQVTTTGKHSPTVYLNGRCKAGNIVGCRYWMMIADNRPPGAPATTTPDIVSFLIFDAAGNRMAYGTGPVVSGDVSVAPTSW